MKLSITKKKPRSGGDPWPISGGMA